MTSITLELAIAPEQPGDAPVVERLHERAFGPGRFARTAFRLREGARPLLPLSFVARVGTLMVASVRLSPISIGAAGSPRAPALVLGPLTVERSFKNRGIGTALLEAALEAARASGHSLVILVGDEPFYGRVGFRRVPPGRLGMPGPVDPARLLFCELVPGAFASVSGLVAPADEL
jgi:predicted N-acetyltransferase YhbS